jgi:hypothetical protein
MGLTPRIREKILIRDCDRNGSPPTVAVHESRMTVAAVAGNLGTIIAVIRPGRQSHMDSLPAAASKELLEVGRRRGVKLG